ncbi:electron transport complex subunit RsxG [Catenovulum adriaticum]|uniref:Ion-translocating oxidoreductase complex subunit G n=1 Tax=Catenovulum adriaticum TaxID=2984846 RepID=A0ABY7AJS1_9ALTE|nr:electron transport complex subunit RsxG [Catenovulum sp. TS8]WAJ69497.1 electron transport complex subunit RsxG [Catenovulum sp. TS8]
MFKIHPISKASAILTLFAIVTTGLVTVTHLLTKQKITEEKNQAILKNINAIMPKALYNNDITTDCRIMTDNNQQAIRVFRARLDNKPTGLVIESIAPDGYSGRIDLLVGIDTQQKIKGVRTTSHSETPGLGDKIEYKKSRWITFFNELKLTPENESSWAVRKDGGQFDQFTGATITPRAVVKSIKNTLLWAQQQDNIFELDSNCGESK